MRAGNKYVFSFPLKSKTVCEQETFSLSILVRELILFCGRIISCAIRKHLASIIGWVDVTWVARQACSNDTHLHIAFTHYIRSLPGLITQGANGGCGGKAAKLPAPPTASQRKPDFWCSSPWRAAMPHEAAGFVRSPSSWMMATPIGFRVSG